MLNHRLFEPIFYPRPYQQDAFNFFVRDKGKFGIFNLPRGHGKDCLSLAIMGYLAMQRVGQYMYAFPYLGQARTALWSAIDDGGSRPLDFIPREFLYVEPNQTRMELVLRNPKNWQQPGSIIKLVGSNDGGEAMRGPNYVGVVLSEAAYMDEEVREVFVPRLEKNDGWLILNSTANGRNWFCEIYHENLDVPTTFTIRKNYRECKDWDGNLILPEEKVQKLLDSKMLREAAFKREFMNDWDAASDTAIFKDQLDKAIQTGRIGKLNLSPTIPVQTFWDIGVNKITGRTAIWFVQLHPNGDVHFVDYYEDYDKSTTHYTNYIIQWAQNNEILLGKQYLPHDSVQRSKIDLKQYNHSVQEKMRRDAKKIGMGVEVIPRIKQKYLAFDMAARHFRKFYFHTPACDEALEKLRSYQGDSSSINDKLLSHCVDAFLAVSQYIDYDTHKSTIASKRILNPFQQMPSAFG